MNWLIFSLVFSFQIILTIPNFIKTCQSKTFYTWFLYFFHHLLDVFLFWSFLFLTNKYEFLLHFILLILIVIHWATYDNKCILTVLMNRECGYSDEKWLDSIKNRLGLTYIYEHFHYIWMLLLAIQDIYQINSILHGFII